MADSVEKLFKNWSMRFCRRAKTITRLRSVHYQRGLELDNLAEELYRRLIVTFQKRGQLAGALEVYRRCRQMLSIVLGVGPSKEIEVLYQTRVAGAGFEPATFGL